MSSEYKYKHWVMTIMTNAEFSLPDLELVLGAMKTICAEYTFQEEVGEGGMIHYQCAFITKLRQRQRTVIKDFSSLIQHPEFLIQVDRCRDYDAAVLYCSDSFKRKKDSLAFSNRQQVVYTGDDVMFLADKERRFPWQNQFMEIFFDPNETGYKPADDRSIIWITDPIGKSGKSTFCKYLRYTYDHNYKVPWGSATQIRTSIVEKGPQSLYILDVPRTLGEGDSMSSFFSVIEDTKNGYVSTAMHGNPRELLMSPPHVVVFSNKFPELAALSEDRWTIYTITPSKSLDLL